MFTKDEPAGVDDRLNYGKIKNAILGQGDDVPTVDYAKPGFDDSSWRKLDLPHDWAIEGPFNYDYQGATGKLKYWGRVWYRKHFTLPKEDAGRKLSVEFDGAMSYATVFVNGKFVGGWPYGYASWAVDVTNAVKLGEENVIAVRLDSPQDSSRWYPGAGIYRNVWLTKTNPVHVKRDGVFVTTPEVSDESAKVVVATEVEGANDAVVKTTIKDDAGKVIAQAEGKSATVNVAKPKRWSIETPVMYTAVTTVEQGGKVVDEVQTPFGIRTIAFDANNGFLLNGKRVPLNGVCNHHDLGALGAAINVRAIERQLEILKEMGCNSIRTSHNPPAPELLDLCDRMGFVVMDEAFDCWLTQKRKGDYHLLWNDWHEKDLRAFVRRDRNHPSVVLWSIGNEIPDQKRPEGVVIAKELTKIVKDEDPTRLTTSACNNATSYSNGFAKGIDVFGDNYDHNQYARIHKANPDQPVLGSETASCISTRGVYVFPVEEDKDKGKANFQMSSYDLYAPRWAWPPDYEFKQLDQNPFTAGEYVWTGFDYIGEPTPYNNDMSNLLNFNDPAERERAEKELKELGKVRTPSRSSYFGILDLAGFKKDRFYLYQSRWRPEFNMVHVLPHWNWPGRVGQVTPIHVYTNGDQAEVFLNGKSLGKKKKGQFEYRLRWDDVKYEPGEVKVVAYKDGKQIAETTTRTTGEPAKLGVSVDRAPAADGQDLAFVTITVLDKDGLVVPTAKNNLKISAEGPAEIVATDNGDPTDHVIFSSHDRKAFNGLALAIIRPSAGKAGAVTVNVTSDGLANGTLTFNTK